MAPERDEPRRRIAGRLIARARPERAVGDERVEDDGGSVVAGHAGEGAPAPRPRLRVRLTPTQPPSPGVPAAPAEPDGPEPAGQGAGVVAASPEPTPARAPEAGPRPGRAPAAAPAPRPTPEPAPAPDDDAGPAPVEAPPEPVEPVELEPARRDRTRRPRIRAATAAFGAAIVLLAIAVPLLSWFGWHWVKTGRTGVTRTNRSGTLGGGERLMPFTPTALFVLTKDDGTPVSAALFALNHGGSGGAVTFVPLDTTVPNPAYGIDRLRTAFSLGGISGFTRSASQVLRLTFTDTVVLDPNAFAGLLAPVGPLTVSNPGYFTSGSTAFQAGTIQVAPTQAVAYLNADEARSQDTADRRLQAFLQAWFDAVKRAGPTAVVGEGDTGMGRYVRAMSKGPVDFEALPAKRRVVPGVYGAGDQVLYDVQEPEASRLLARVVPFPQAPPNSRLVIRLLNGVDTGGIPNSIVQRLVLGGGQVALEGATRGKALSTTELRYGDRGLTDRVKQLRRSLGAGKLVVDDAVSDPGEVTVVLGRDLLENPPAPLSTSGNGG